MADTDQIDREVDPAKRQALIRQSEAIFEQDPPLLPVAWEKIDDVWYNYVKGLRPDDYFGAYDVCRQDTFWLDKSYIRQRIATGRQNSNERHEHRTTPVDPSWIPPGQRRRDGRGVRTATRPTRWRTSPTNSTARSSSSPRRSRTRSAAACCASAS